MLVSIQAAAWGQQVAFDAPERAVTPGQALVLYAGEVCLGAAPVAHPGATHHECGLALPTAAAAAADHSEGVLASAGAAGACDAPGELRSWAAQALCGVPSARTRVQQACSSVVR